MPDRYSRTLTLFWMRLVAHVSERRPAPTFAEFLDAERWLLDPGLARRHYSPELLSSGRARRVWVDPDLIAMPA
jgi:hypothetical protein